MVSKGEMWVFDSSCITQPQSQISTDSIAHRSQKYRQLDFNDALSMLSVDI